MSNCTLKITTAVEDLQKVTSIPTFIFGVLGNICVLVMFCRLPRAKWTYMNVYITNMAIADCALLMFLPVKIHYYSRPLEEHLKALCNVVLSVYYVNMNAVVVCALIWFTICSISPVYFVTDSNNDKTMCFQRVKGALSLHFVLLLVIVGFLVPFLIMLFCSVRVVCTLRKQLDIGSRSEKIQCMFIIMANLVVFVICFLPVHLGYLVKHIVQNKYANAEDNESCDYKLAAHNFLHIALCISNMNCGLDCFSYFFATKTSWNMCCMNETNSTEGECDYNTVSDPVSTPT